MEEVTYSDLLPFLQKLKEGCEWQHYIIPLENAGTGPEEADTPYNIITIEQLQLWAEAEPEQVLIALNQLQEQRDLGMAVSEGVSHLQAELDSLQADKEDFTKALAKKNANFSALNVKYQLHKERH